MFTILAATLGLAQAPQLPAQQGVATLALAVERTRLTAVNYTNQPQWLVFENGAGTLLRCVAPHSQLSWDFPASCLVEVEVRTLQQHGQRWVRSERFALQEFEGLFFAADARAFGVQQGTLEPLDCFHVPVIRPESRPNGGLPPKIGDKPLPPV
jgi:hypothetical protein